MKIGILTFHNTTNYGAIFQCYALQKHIQDLGYDCEVVDYNNQTLKSRYELNPFKSKGIKEFIKKAIFYLPELKNKKYFEEFRRKYIKISDENYNENTIKNSDERYDKFIAGSDQVWNFKLSGNDFNYFMTFTDQKKKRNSYAASFGSLNNNNIDEVVKLLKLQNNISIREDNAKKELEKSFPNIQQSIDPVFLIKKESWMDFINKRRIVKEKYIFVYEVARTELLRDFACFLSKKYGFKIIYLSKSGSKMKNVKKIFSVSPSDFLNYLYYSEYVITSSFHGMALSIILGKEFFYDTPSDKKEFGSRLESLSRLCGLENRRICKDYNKIPNDAISYNEVYKKVDIEIEHSKEYLQRVLNEK